AHHTGPHRQSGAGPRSEQRAEGQRDGGPRDERGEQQRGTGDRGERAGRAEPGDRLRHVAQRNQRAGGGERADRAREGQDPDGGARRADHRTAASRSARSLSGHWSSMSGSVSRPVAQRSSRSATAGLRARAGPWAYVPSTLPCQAPSVTPSLPMPTRTRASGAAAGPRWVRPPWFSNPVSGGRPSRGSISPTSSPTARESPRSEWASSRSSPPDRKSVV